MEQAAEHDRIIGTQIGNYEVRHKLGEGGMGSVYLAEHPHIGKKVALKVLHSEYANNEDVVARFFNEAKAVNDIQHPNIVDIVDYGVIHDEHGGKTVYFIMEFLAGESLSQLIRRESPLPPERALTICIQVADALAASHQKGIIHRDLKPDNVMLIQRRRMKDFPKVLDFGIAKLTGDQAGSRRTRTGIVMGTPAYMSPEQCEGKGLIDSRTDVYALGILLYEMLTGRVPFAGEGYGEVLVQHLTQPPTKLTTIRAGIPPHVETVVLKALEKRPDARYPTMEEFMRALADPVGYVEAHGGLSNFLHNPITPSDNPQPLPMISPLTPVPGTLTSLTPAPGQLTPAPGNLQTPTTLSGGAAEVASQGGGKKLGLIAALVAAVAVIGGGTFLATRGGDEQAAATVDEPVQPDPELVAEPVTPVVTDPVVVADAAVAVLPPEPVKVTVKVESSPGGANVYVGDEKKPRGQTPLELDFEHLPGAEARKVEIRLEKSRYHDRTETISLTAEETAVAFDWTLKRRSTSSSSKSGGSKSGGTKSTGGKSDGDLGGQIMTPSFGKKKQN